MRVQYKPSHPAWGMQEVTRPTGLGGRVVRSTEPKPLTPVVIAGLLLDFSCRSGDPKHPGALLHPDVLQAALALGLLQMRTDLTLGFDSFVELELPMHQSELPPTVHEMLRKEGLTVREMVSGLAVQVALKARGE
jgi:hypothetical protein